MHKMMKKSMLAIGAAAMIFGAYMSTAAMAYDFSFTSTNTVTSTESEEDADGNITTITTIERTENGETTTSTIKEFYDAESGRTYVQDIPLTIENRSDLDLAEFYFSESTEDWGDNWFEEEGVLQSGYKANGTLTVDKDGTLVDVCWVDTEGHEYVLRELELKNVSREEVTFSIEGNAEEGYGFYYTTFNYSEEDETEAE
ncbi:MAG: hypothetical protein Q4B59_01740 [Lachnospiraceae bacterium]|nr:hypothetical protein [Lachnospiraceae bacterium]